MPTMDENIEATIATMLASACTGSNAEGRKIPAWREDDGNQKILLACAYDREYPGENTDDRRRNVFYNLLIVMYSRSNLGNTGDETLNDWRQTTVRLLYGPTLPGVPEVENMRFMKLPRAAIPPLPPGIDTQAVFFEIETYEPAL